MSEYEAWAPVYDAWTAHMTEDVAHVVELARGDVAGLEVEALHGWFDRRPFDDDSDAEYVWVTRKPLRTTR